MILCFAKSDIARVQKCPGLQPLGLIEWNLIGQRTDGSLRLKYFLLVTSFKFYVLILSFDFDNLIFLFGFE